MCRIYRKNVHTIDQDSGDYGYDHDYDSDSLDKDSYFIDTVSTFSSHSHAPSVSLFTLR